MHMHRTHTDTTPAVLTESIRLYNEYDFDNEYDVSNGTTKFLTGICKIAVGLSLVAVLLFYSTRIAQDLAVHIIRAEKLRSRNRCKMKGSQYSRKSIQQYCWPLLAHMYTHNPLYMYIDTTINKASKMRTLKIEVNCTNLYTYNEKHLMRRNIFFVPTVRAIFVWPWKTRSLHLYYLFICQWEEKQNSNTSVVLSQNFRLSSYKESQTE